MAGQNDNTKKILLGVGCGCLALVGLCCGSAGVLALVRKSSFESAAQAHAERFLGYLQSGDDMTAFDTAVYDGDGGLYSAITFHACIEATPLADLTTYSCSDVDAEWVQGGHADVTCTITSATRGTSDVTIGVNGADSSPYLGFIWFSPGVTTGPGWHGDDCATWSGREFFREPPAGRVRP